MKKRYILSAVGGAIGSTAAGYYLKDKANREKVVDQAKNIQNEWRDFTDGNDSTFEDAGVPDQSENKSLEQLENAKMVSEGSQFGVQYYNEYKNKNELEQQQ